MLRSALLVATVVLGGCRIGTLSPEEFDREYPLGRLTTLASPGRDDSLAALREAVGSPVRITSLQFWDDRTQITAQNPRKSSNFDTYTYWQGDVTRSAVELRGDAEQRMIADLFELDSVPFDRLPELARAARAALPIEGARVSRVGVDRASGPDGGLVIEVTLDSERRDGRVVYDGQGKLVSAKAD